MLFIFVEKLTPRVQYVFNYVFNDLLRIDYELVNNLEKFNSYNGPKLSYGSLKITSNHIFSASLLFENEIKKIEWPINVNGKIPKLFPVESRALIDFDIFSAIFFMISRYEEYLPFEPDNHGRFTSNQSVAFKYNFLRIPIVNIWAEELKQAIKIAYPEITFEKRKFEFINTFDIDNAFAYKSKPLWRKLGSLIRSLSLFDFNNVQKRFLVWFGKEKDPYDTFELILDTHQKFGFNSIMFFLLGDYGSHDKNVSSKNKTLQSLIQKMNVSMNIGIHPSYNSNSKPEMLGLEKERLENITKSKINSSRQHYLKLNFPSTYLNLIQNGITKDFTLSYADDWGFRAGTCVPFSFFNLENNEATNLVLYPNTIMEATFKYYLKLSPEEAQNEIRNAIDEVYKVGGTFISLWHNESLSDTGNWKGWRNVYLNMIDYVNKKRI